MTFRQSLVIVGAIVYLITGFAMMQLGVPIPVIGLFGIGIVALSLIVERWSGPPKK